MGRSPTNVKQKLIETAVSLIWQSSYASVSVDDICKAADAKKGSFYYYFKSKADLALEAMEAFYQQYKPVFDDIFSNDRDPIDRLEKYLDTMYQAQLDIAQQYGKVCGCPFASLGSEIAGQDEMIRLKIEDVFNRKKTYFQKMLHDMVTLGYIPKEINTKELADQIHAYILGEILIARIRNDLTAIKKNLKTNVFEIIGLNVPNQKSA